MGIVAIVGGTMCVPSGLCEETLTPAPAPSMKARGRPETGGERALVDRRDEPPQSCGKGMAAVRAPPLENFGTLRMPTAQGRSLAESYGFHPSGAIEEDPPFFFVAAQTTGDCAVSGIGDILFFSCCPLCGLASIGASALDRASPIVPLFSCRPFLFFSRCCRGSAAKANPRMGTRRLCGDTIFLFLFFFVLFSSCRRRAVVGAKTRCVCGVRATSAKAPDGSDERPFSCTNRLDVTRHTRDTKADPKNRAPPTGQQGKDRTEPIPTKRPPFFITYLVVVLFKCRLLSWILTVNCQDLSWILHVYILVFCAVSRRSLTTTREPPEQRFRRRADILGPLYQTPCRRWDVSVVAPAPFAHDQSLSSPRSVSPIFFHVISLDIFFPRLAAARCTGPVARTARREKKQSKKFFSALPRGDRSIALFSPPLFGAASCPCVLRMAGGLGSLFFYISMRKISRKPSRRFVRLA